MVFKRPVQRYGRTPQPETPYQRAGQLWDERIGSARVQAKNWRLAAFVALAMSAGLAGALAWQSAQSRVTPYVVEVDRLGEARAVSPVAAGYRPTDPQVAWHLARFIRNVRAVPTDPVLVREQWLQAYDFVTKRGAVFLSEYARASDPFARIGERSVSVQVTSVVRASPTSFQVKWQEQAFERGSLASTQRWTALLTVDERTPRDAEVLRRNPLGLYVDAIDWTRELEPARPPARPDPGASQGGPSAGEPLATAPADPEPPAFGEAS
jgi:type IV secretion system protein VirB5